MDWSALKLWFGKYKFALLILFLGLGFMMIPEKEEPAPELLEPAAELTMQEQLQNILASIEGAGRVEVLLTLARGSRVHYQTDRRQDTDGERENLEEKTVIVTGMDRTESGLVLQTDPPVYQGAVIVCQGADRAEVKLAIVEAVRCATGLGANQISVVKMK